MSVILYLETNFIVGAAFGQDEKANILLQIPPAELQIALPSVCIMEVWAVFEAEKKQRNTLKETLNDQIGKLRRYPNSPHAQALIKHLLLALTENADLLNDVEVRLRDFLSKVFGLQAGFFAVELLPLTQAAFQGSLSAGLTKDHTDNLILAVILAHASEHPPDEKVFLSGNIRDFQTPEIEALLSAAGITRYFARTDDFLGWFHAENQPDSKNNST